MKKTYAQVILVLSAVIVVLIISSLALFFGLMDQYIKQLN